jgi:hypothetical protein
LKSLKLDAEVGKRTKRKREKEKVVGTSKT